MVTVEELAGYVLEDILAALLQDNGYRLLVHKKQDMDALDDGSNGLVVRGRGASHQVDVLGELELGIPFALPVRLFLEAKCRKKTTGIADIRNALGVISDINERHRADDKDGVPLRRYQYRYALFSTSGFAHNAQQFALAHQISLIDLQGPAFTDLRDLALDTANALLEITPGTGHDAFPVNEARVALRRALGTWPKGVSTRSPARRANSLPTRALNKVARQLASRIGGSKLFLGFPLGPFVLVLQPDDPDVFDAFLKVAPSLVAVDIGFGSSDGVHGEWAIIPQDVAYRDIVVRFGVPPLLESWLLTTSGINPGRVAQVKELLLQSISVFHHENRLTRFRYEKVQSDQPAGDEVSEGSPALRSRLMAPEFRYRSWSRPRSRGRASDVLAVTEMFRDSAIKRFPAQSGGGWTLSAVEELLRRLRSRGLLWQAEVIVAASRNDQGVVNEDEVFQIARDSGAAVLDRLIHSVGEIDQQLRLGGLIGDKSQPALLQLRARQGEQRHSHYEVPPEFRVYVEPAWHQAFSL